MGATKLVFELWELKAKMKGVFSRSYCCYGNLLCHKIDRNIVSNDCADFRYHEFGINQYRVVLMILQSLGLAGNCFRPPKVNVNYYLLFLFSVDIKVKEQSVENLMKWVKVLRWVNKNIFSFNLHHLLNYYSRLIFNSALYNLLQ